MKSGLFALASLDGGPLEDDEAGVLGLTAEAGARAMGLAVRVHDGEEGGRAAHIARTGDCFVAFLGHLNEPRDLAAALGMSRDAPQAELALAALDRFGAEAPLHMLGEWSLLRWRGAERSLTVMMSEACRDPLYFATDGRRVAIAPEIRRLARLDWVDDAFDPAGLALQLSRARLRRIMTTETFLSGVSRVTPGSSETFGPTRATSSLPPQPAREPWTGSFESAVETIETLLRRIVGQHLGRHRRVASLLSGGLDSSLLAWLAAETRQAGQELTFLTSVAPEGSGIQDQLGFARTVSDHLGLDVIPVCPPPDASAYIPAARVFEHGELPVASPRHYLYGALYDTAADLGADVLLDGVYGELTITNRLPLAPARMTARHALRVLRGRFFPAQTQGRWPSGAFHARLSNDALADLPPAWGSEWRAPYRASPPPRVDRPWGYLPAVAKNAMTPTTAFGGGMRHLQPYRDRRLIRLMASMPAGFMQHDGLNRALARAILKGRLPDSISLRRSGGPFSPDFDLRLRTQTDDVLDRMGDFRDSGAGDWLDLAWLSGAMTRMREGRPMTIHEPFQAQATAIAAAFFVWWKTGKPN